MNNQINEGAARYKLNNDGTNPPVPSTAQAPAAGKKQRNPQQLLTDHLDLWTSTVRHKSTAGRGRGSGKSSKLELTGIKKLRELILELAVRGKLVPQNPDDEPAAELLQRIETEKAQLVKDGKLKKQKPLPPVNDDEKPFELPEGWEWVRFGDATFNRDAERIPLSVDERQHRRGEFDYYGASGVIDNIDDYLFEKPLLLIGEDGANLINRSTPIAFMARGKYWVNNHAHVIDGISEQFLIYIGMYINSISLVPYVTGTAQPKMNQAKMNTIVLAIPPLAEQQRIVAKVDELMALCDQLEQQSEHQLTAHQQLTDTLLSTLTESADAQELNDNWKHLAQHFDLLFSGPMGAWAIDRLKDTILQLAVMGKLVPQNAEDEPASKLLKRIEEEKARLVKEGKIKKPKKLPPVNDEEQPFELPQEWEWVRLLNLGYELGGGTPSKSNPKYWAGHIPWVSPKDMKLDYIAQTIDYVTDLAVVETSIKLVPANSLLFVVRGMILDHSFPVAINLKPVTINQDMKSLSCSGINMDFALVGLKGRKKFYVEAVERSSHGTCKLNSDTLWQSLFPLPPLAEQHRIVAKVDELFALCDQLKERLQQASETEQQLTNAIVEQTLG